MSLLRWKCTCTKCPDVSLETCDVSKCIMTGDEVFTEKGVDTIRPGVVARYRIGIEAMAENDKKPQLKAKASIKKIQVGLWLKYGHLNVALLAADRVLSISTHTILVLFSQLIGFEKLNAFGTETL